MAMMAMTTSSSISVKPWLLPLMGQTLGIGGKRWDHRPAVWMTRRRRRSAPRAVDSRRGGKTLYRQGPEELGGRRNSAPGEVVVPQQRFYSCLAQTSRCDEFP